MNAASDYLTAVVHRARVPMDPAGFQPRWSDKPRPHKFFPGVERFPLSGRAAPSLACLQDGLFPTRALSGPGAPGSFTMPLLGDMLLDTYGEVTRRLAINANPDVPALPNYRDALWARGTASGGGLYPVSVYWVNGPSAPALPGVHYYSPRHHAMQRLLTGDVSGVVRDAIGDSELAGDTDQFLVLTVKFWQNSFKYGSFSYHVVTMDVGAVIEAWRLWALAQGMSLQPVLWFDEPRLNRLLDVGATQEGIFAVVPLAWDAAPDPGSAPASATSGAHDGVRAARTDRERSRHVVAFPILRALHEATTQDAGHRPPVHAVAAGAVRTTAGSDTGIALPPPESLAMPVTDALRARRSSFGRFVSRPALDPRLLGTVLAASTASAAFPCDVTDPEKPTPLVKLYVFVNHVDGVPPGSYEFDPGSHALLRIDPNPPGEFLERTYFLDNYSMDQAAAVIVPTARPTAVHEALGARGYRLVNASVGAVAQAAYVTCAALGIGCGAALGFDNVAYIDELKLSGTDEIPLLIIMIGNENQAVANFRYDIVH